MLPHHIFHTSNNLFTELKSTAAPDHLYISAQWLNSIVDMCEFIFLFTCVFYFCFMSNYVLSLCYFFFFFLYVYIHVEGNSGWYVVEGKIYKWSYYFYRNYFYEIAVRMTYFFDV